MSKVRGFRAEDIARISGIKNLEVSPDKSRVVYELSTVNVEDSKRINDIYTVPLMGGEPKQITDSGKNSLPSWSPSGEWIAYVESDETSNTIYIIDSETKNKRKIAEFSVSNASLGVGTVGKTIKWSPDGSSIAYLASLGKVDKEKKIKVIDRIMYKSFFGYSDMRRRHVFLVSALGSEKPRQLTYGDNDEHSIEFSPDGKEILFVSNRTGDSDYNMQLNISAVDTSTREIKEITDIKGAVYYPTYSPDGRKIAYISTTRKNTSNESTPEDKHVWVINSDGSNPIDLSKKLDRLTNRPPRWTHDSKSIIFTALNHGRVPVYRVNLDGEITQIKSGNKSYGNICVTDDERLVYTWNDPVTPDEIYVSKDGEEKKLTTHNDFLKEKQLSWPEEFKFSSSDGYEIQGWVIKPHNFDSSKKYPTLLNIKGGPSGMRGYSFNSHIQSGPGYGYVQVFLNYRGSSGYGQKFSDAVVCDMLGGEYRDNMEGLDYVIANMPFVDADRLGVWGCSYGGYLTNWAVTQTPRFKAAVAISSISNLWSQWGASAIPLWLEVEIEGLPWERKDLMEKQSPLFQAHKAKTPTLFLHGELDFDTPIVEAEQMFMALKKNKVETVMVRYVDDGHGMRMKPMNQVDVINRAMAWFNKYL